MRGISGVFQSDSDDDGDSMANANLSILKEPLTETDYLLIELILKKRAELGISDWQSFWHVFHRFYVFFTC